MLSLNVQMENFVKFRLVWAGFSDADGTRRTDRHHEANNRFTKFCERAQKRTDWNLFADAAAYVKT